MKKILLTLLTCVMLLPLFMGCAGKSTEAVEFTLNNGAEPSSLDPHKISGVPEHRIYEALFEGLVRNNPKTTRGEPGLAESWVISEDSTVYTFKIRKGAKWSDGVAITAETVRDSWFRELDPEVASPYSWFPGLFIKGANEYVATGSETDKAKVAIRALDSSTFQFETVGPLPYTIDALTHYSFAVVPLHTIEKFGADWVLPENFVGNGPFVLQTWNPQEKIMAVKNNTYWDKKNVFIDNLIFFPVSDLNTSFNMFENNELDWDTKIPTGKYDEIKGRPDLQVSPALITYFYEFNINRAPLDDIRVRQALFLSIGRDGITQQILGEGQVNAYGIVPPMDSYKSITPMTEDVSRAKQLLADAGFPDGAGFPTLTILYNTSEGHKTIAEYAQQRWKETLNIDMKLQNQEWKTYLTTREEHDFDIARGGWQGDYLDPNTFLDLFVTGSAINHAGYASAEYDNLIAQAARSSGQARLDMLSEAEDKLINQDTIMIPIYYYVRTNMIDLDTWEGWYTNVLDVHPYIGLKKKQ